MELKTNRLYIRPFNKNDIEDTYEIYSNDEVCRYLLEYAWDSCNKEIEFSKKLDNKHLTEDSSLNLAVVLNYKLIGDISVWYTGMKGTVEIGFLFNPEYANKGYAKESVQAVIKSLFAEYNIHRIQANLDARNKSSAKLCENLGMRLEDHFIKDFWNKGEWTDSYVYGMLIEDVEEL